MGIPRKEIGGTCGQLLHQLRVLAGSAYTVQASKPGQDRLHIRSGKQGTVDLISFHDRDSAVLSRFCHQRDSCHAQGFDIPVDGAAGDFELLRKVGGCYLLFLQQNGQYADHSVKLHMESPLWLRYCYCIRSAGNWLR